MYVGITRARATLAISTLRRRKRATHAALPSRFIAKMKLHETQPVADPRAKLMALRAAAVERAAAERSQPAI